MKTSEQGQKIKLREIGSMIIVCMAKNYRSASAFQNKYTQFSPSPHTLFKPYHWAWWSPILHPARLLQAGASCQTDWPLRSQFVFPHWVTQCHFCPSGYPDSTWIPAPGAPSGLPRTACCLVCVLTSWLESLFPSPLPVLVPPGLLCAWHHL